MPIFYKKPTDIVISGGGSEQTECVRLGTLFTCCGLSLLDTTLMDDETSLYAENTQDGIVINNTSGGTIILETVLTDLPAGSYSLVNYGVNIPNNLRIYIQFDLDNNNYLLGSEISMNFDIEEPSSVRLFILVPYTGDMVIIKPTVTIRDSYMHYLCYYERLYQPYTTCGTLTAPCNLYEGDEWHPITGQVKRNNNSTEQYLPQPLLNASKFWNIYQNPFQESNGLTADLRIDDLLPFEIRKLYKMVNGQPKAVMICGAAKNGTMERVLDNSLETSSADEAEFYTSDSRVLYTNDYKKFIVRRNDSEILI